MTAEDLVERYASNLHGVLSCFDRVIIVGTLPDLTDPPRDGVTPWSWVNLNKRSFFVPLAWPGFSKTLYSCGLRAVRLLLYRGRAA